MSQKPSKEVLLSDIQERYQLSGALSDLPGEYDYNYRLETNHETYLVKIITSDSTRIEYQIALFEYLDQQNKAAFQIPRAKQNRAGRKLSQLETNAGQCTYGIFHWVTGQLYHQISPKREPLWQSLGDKLGRLSTSLEGFEHPDGHIWLKWDIMQTTWISPHVHIFKDSLQRGLVQHFLERFQQIESELKNARHSMIYNDANDHNIIVKLKDTTPHIVGFIDFGDSIYSATICEIAVAIAYAAMDQRDPLKTATTLLGAYHKQYPVLEEELNWLYDLVAARLIISVTVSNLNRLENPANEYLNVSEQSAWALLEKWNQITPEFALYSFRGVCNFTPCPAETRFQEWLSHSKSLIGPIIQFSGSSSRLDLSIDSPILGHFTNYGDTNKFHTTLTRYFKDHDIGLGYGGYGEYRPFYQAKGYLDDSDERRTQHLGFDVWMPECTTVLSPLSGQIYSVSNNEGPLNYGPTIICQYAFEKSHFLVLFGHLSLADLKSWSPGDHIKKGQQIGVMGEPSENGGWPPHVHIQVILNDFYRNGDFPGVVRPREWQVWSSICPNPEEFFSWTNPTNDSTSPIQILKKRKELLGYNLSVSYKKPLLIQRGQLQYLINERGQFYLDTVNNVAHVGHEHPLVVQAANQQNVLLNTNTRYLHDNIIQYAEKLLSKLPAELEVVYFVNSGSEANELAIRIAKTISGRQSMIAIEHGYHGNTNTCIDVSSYKFDGKGGGGKPADTYLLPMPDTFRGKFKGNGASQSYISDAIEILNHIPNPIAGLIFESILSCGGQVPIPELYLPAVGQRVRDMGGICIADEVQVGFGRVGSHFWAVKKAGFVPDILTMGKPIGNGYPLGAVAMKRSIAEAFNNGMEFFSTFGGNPVACAVGLSVLSAIEQENLQQNAENIGSEFKAGLMELMHKHAILADVRGSGLFLGFELVKQDGGPAFKSADYLVNRMKEHRILISWDGPDHNVIKIKPPICFNSRNMSRYIETLDVLLQEDYIVRDYAS